MQQPAFLTNLLCLAALLLALTSATVSSAADEAPRTPAQLVEQLGNPIFAKREAAREELAQREFEAWPALEEGLKSRDLEIRYHCERLMDEIRERSRQRQLSEFVAQADTTKKYDFPAWEKLRAIVGDSKASRQLYADMYTEEPETLKSLEKGEDIGNQVQARALRFLRVVNGVQPAPTTGNIAALLFIACQENVSVPANGMSYLSSLLSNQAFRDGITSPDKGPLLRKLLGQFISRGDANMAYQAMNLAMQYDLKDEALVGAKKALEGKGAAPAKYYAALAVAKFGNKEHLPLLAGAVDDKTLVTQTSLNGKLYQTQVRDVALFGMIHLSKKEYKDFGYDRVQLNPTMVANIATLGFENDEKRDAALAAWKKHQEAEKATAAAEKKK